MKKKISEINNKINDVAPYYELKEANLQKMTAQREQKQSILEKVIIVLKIKTVITGHLQTKIYLKIIVWLLLV